MAERKFRILALDGGGIRGVISATLLERVQQKIGQPLNEYFDLIAGTSTGSILATGLVLGIPIEDLIKIYRERGQEIFRSNFVRQNIGYWLNQPKYSNEGLKKVLKEYFGEIPLEKVREESKKRFPDSNPKARLLILAYCTNQRCTDFFLSPFVDESPWYKEAKLWEICLSSASAPTFFPPYYFSFSRDTYVDGGVAANNPSLGALVHTLDIERIDGQKIKLDQIALLSIGTGRTTQPLEFKEVNSWGALGWASHIPDVFMGGQFQITADLCRQLIDSVNPNGYLRLQFPLNQRYDHKQSGETVRLPTSEEVNAYTNEYIDEAIDRADIPHIDNLIKTATAFLDHPKNDYCTFDGVRCSTDQAIAKFIEVNR